MHLGSNHQSRFAFSSALAGSFALLLGVASSCPADPVANPSASATPAIVQFNDAGLTSLKAGDTELVADGTLKMIDLTIGGVGVKNDDFDSTKVSFDRATGVLTHNYRWGVIKAVYRPSPVGLDVDLSVTNIGTKALSRVGINIMQVNFPSVPDGTDWEHRYSPSCDRADEIPVVMADWKTGHLALCSPDPNQFAKFGFYPDGVSPWDARVRFDDKPIPSGQTRTTRLSFRVGAGDKAGEKPWDSATDVLRRYAEKYPSELKWDDRRPIGSAFIASSMAGIPKNPRGWLLDHEIDTTTPGGIAQFKVKMMAYADHVIKHCKDLNAQGVIVWDVEGQEMPHATSYLADPRMLSKVAPEMDAIADEFFKKFTDAGLRTGITVRPTRVAPADGGRPGWMQQDVSDQPAEIDAKITYAQKRWGCTLFYVDSNVDFVKDSTGKVLSDPAMPADAFRKLASHHKDCLLMPEHKSGRYYAYTAPYSEFRLGIVGTPPGVLATYPHAFSVLRVVDGPSLSDPDSISKLSASVRNGDILLFRPWWDDPQTADIQHIIANAAGGSHP